MKLYLFAAIVGSFITAQASAQDLAVSNVSIVGDRLSGEVVQVSFRVTNVGASSGQLRSVEVSVSNDLQVDESGVIASFSSGQSRTFTAPITLPTVAPGSALSSTVRVVIGGLNDFNFSNNTATIFPTVFGREPDLECYAPPGFSGPLVVSTSTGTTTTSPVFTDADPLFVDFAVINTGDSMLPTGGGIQVQMFLNGASVSAPTPLPPLAQGAFDDRFDVPLGTLPAGDYLLELVIDADDFVFESDEGNNTCSFSFTVVPAAPSIDLGFFTAPGAPGPIFVSAQAAPGLRGPFTEGEVVFLSFAYRNLGADPTGLFAVGIAVNGVPVATFDDQLSGGAERIIEDVEVTGLPVGDNLIQVFLDAFEEIDEFSEGNNVESVFVTVDAPCPADWNSDGTLNDQDFFDWANDFFNGAGPQGDADFNDDGNENDQDWFDFTNAFFDPAPSCG